MTVGTTYRAFISYSRADLAVARRLQALVETYRVPSALVADGAPPRVYPVFRDQSDMVVGADLAAIIRAALLASDALIVVCSPAAAASAYVDLEVRTFAAAYPDRPILAVIAAGDPTAPPPAGCFPPALVAEGREPLAADLRPGGDGWKTTRLKLIAALTGIDATRLARRDEQRRVRRLRLFAGLALAAIAVLGVLLWQSIAARRDAERQRAAAEEQVEFTIGDLRAQVEPLGKLSLLDALAAKALSYYEHQDMASLGPASLARRARVLRMVGEIRTKQGKLDAAERSFRAAADSTGRLLAQSPDDPQRIFDHAQDVFYIGNVAYQRRRLDQAQAAFQRYRLLAERLVAINPKNPKWRPEIGYAYSNLGTVLLDRGRNTAAEAAFRRALSVSEETARAAPADASLQIDLAQSRAWLADALSRRGRLAEALAEREDEAAVYRALGTSGSLRLVYLTANNGLVQALLLDELDDRARARSTVAVALNEARGLAAKDPANVEWETLRWRAEFAAEALAGRDDTAAALAARLGRLVAAMPRALGDPRADAILRARAMILIAGKANDAGRDADAVEEARSALALLVLVKPSNTWDVTTVRSQARYELVRALYGLHRSSEAAPVARDLTEDIRHFSDDDQRLTQILRNLAALTGVR